MTKSEHLIQQEILLALGQNPSLRVWRQNTGKVLVENRLISFGLNGAGDISGILKDGRRLEIEVKTPKGKQSPQQKKFQAMIEKYNGVYILSTSVEETIEKLKNYIDY